MKSISFNTLNDLSSLLKKKTAIATDDKIVLQLRNWLGEGKYRFEIRYRIAVIMVLVIVRL